MHFGTTAEVWSLTTLARQRFVPPSLLRVLFLLHLIDAVGISSTEEEEEISRFIDRGIK